MGAIFETADRKDCTGKKRQLAGLDRCDVLVLFYTVCLSCPLINAESNPVGSVVPVDSVAVAAYGSVDHVSTPVRGDFAIAVEGSAGGLTCVLQAEIVVALLDGAGLAAPAEHDE